TPAGSSASWRRYLEGRTTRSRSATPSCSRPATSRRSLRREQVSCYRLYDADIPEYNLAVDLYEEAEAEAGAGAGAEAKLVHAHVQEYAPPKTVDEQAA